MAVFQMLVLGVALYVLVPQFQTFKQHLPALRELEWGWVAAALLTASASYVVSASVYVLLVTKALPLRRTTLVQVASSFANRLLPSGLGNMTLNARYLTKQGFSPSEAAFTVAANQVIGFLSYAFVVFCVSIYGGKTLSENYHFGFSWGYPIIIAGVALLVYVMFQVLPMMQRQQIHSFLRDSLISLVRLARSPRRFALSFTASSGISLVYGLCLYACLLALGVEADIWTALLAYVAASAVGSVAPTPGGLGAFEATMVASLTSLGVEGGEALAVTLLYRLATFWLPIIPGYAVFRMLAAQNRI